VEIHSPSHVQTAHPDSDFRLLDDRVDSARQGGAGSELVYIFFLRPPSEMTILFYYAYGVFLSFFFVSPSPAAISQRRRPNEVPVDTGRCHRAGPRPERLRRSPLSLADGDIRRGLPVQADFRNTRFRVSGKQNSSDNNVSDVSLCQYCQAR
jgi:hypothetical protein